MTALVRINCLKSRPISISDDDLCSSCRFLDYHPGHESTCTHPDTVKWPARFDKDGYAVKCDRYEEIEDVEVPVEL